MHPIALTTEDPSQRRGRSIGSREAGQHEHGVTVTATESAEQRRRRRERAELVEDPLFEREPAETGVRTSLR